MPEVKILLVDDDPVSREILAHELTAAGHQCTTADDGQRAWEMYLRTQPQIIISDRVMPGLDGLDLCRRIRSQMGTHYCYFILLSSLSEKSQIRYGLLNGADDYLSKPVDIEDLHVKLIVAMRIVSLHERLIAQKQALEQTNLGLRNESRSDPLTELGNRLRLREDLELLARRVEREGMRYTVALGDIDHFKAYNDSCGHVAGDAALRAVAAALRAHCRGTDMLYRFGGEEFLVIMPDMGLADGHNAADRLRAAIEALRIHHPGKEPPGPLTMSFGVAEVADGEHLHPNDLMSRADIALYGAKQAGRNTVTRAA
jgi:two-component system chemotaxis response regulator CheY